MATQRARPASAHEETSAGAVAAGRRAMAGGVAGVVLLLLLGSASLALGWWWTVSRSTEVASAMPAIQGRAELRRVAVQPGDTLWELAVRYGPSAADPRRLVQELTALNGLTPGQPLRPGSGLRLPSTWAEPARGEAAGVSRAVGPAAP
ncbi:LysM peptidoglycan-binding domain-containing protein [Geochorda subterranea]|uniref:LysM domain-containing protein n=1 Tax=Geochorda subterranea TaxID=3109564 RepID=A0ABZ1BK50_9FIRM|nr:LysM domain-containing protein [Limnochorda sp. LNt]WRP13255.1 LysM domain-containing protein [Limnochorda sp. LNt]